LSFDPQAPQAVIESYLLVFQVFTVSVILRVLFEILACHSYKKKKKKKKKKKSKKKIINIDNITN